MKKNSKILYALESLSDKIWNHLYGISTVICLVFTLICSYFTIKGEKTDNEIIIIYALLGVVAAFVIMFFLHTVYFQKKLAKMNEMPLRLKTAEDQYELSISIHKQISECSHTISHYYRNNLARIDDFLNDRDNYTNEEILEIIDRFDYFLINITSSLELFFSVATEDNCSITIKLLEKGKGLVKTYFRDPVNNKKRKTSDGSYDGICHFTDNTAFEIIMDPDYKNVYFACDDLIELYNDHIYKNPNSNWHLFYRSTLVVPISMVIGENERNIIGFLSVDNYKGDLSYKPHIEYLFFVGDLLYNIFVKFSELINFAKEKGLENEKIKRFSNWD